MNITVFLGSMDGTPSMRNSVSLLGKWIAEKGHHLIYGGSSTGLMGILARTVLENGGTVTGVELAYLASDRLTQDNLTELIVAETMAERKKIMLERSDVFIAFPGGFGTLEEIAEAMSHTKLGIQKGRCIYLNLEGYYDPMISMLDRMTAYGFLEQEARDAVWFIPSIEELDAKMSGIL